MQRGKLIVIEGGDAAGKATQVAHLTGRLLGEGVMVTQLNFPQYEANHVGKLLRECLDGKRGDFMSVDPRVAAVLYSVDRLESKTRIEQWLNEGQMVLLDRYVSANILHQGAKVGDAAERLETMRWIYKLEHDILDLPKPDAVLTLPVPAAIRAKLRLAQTRTKGRLIDLADQDQVHQQLVDTTLVELENVYDCVTHIDSMDGDELRSADAIAETIYSQVQTVLAG